MTKITDHAFRQYMYRKFRTTYDNRIKEMENALKKAVEIYPVPGHRAFKACKGRITDTKYLHFGSIVFVVRDGLVVTTLKYSTHCFTSECTIHQI